MIVADAAKVHDLALFGDGTQFVTSGEDKLVKLWDDQRSSFASSAAPRTACAASP